MKKRSCFCSSSSSSSFFSCCCCCCCCCCCSCSCSCCCCGAPAGDAGGAGDAGAAGDASGAGGVAVAAVTAAVAIGSLSSRLFLAKELSALVASHSKPRTRLSVSVHVCFDFDMRFSREVVHHTESLLFAGRLSKRPKCFVPKAFASVRSKEDSESPGSWMLNLIQWHCVPRTCALCEGANGALMMKHVLSKSEFETNSCGFIKDSSCELLQSSDERHFDLIEFGSYVSDFSIWLELLV